MKNAIFAISLIDDTQGFVRWLLLFGKLAHMK